MFRTSRLGLSRFPTEHRIVGSVEYWLVTAGEGLSLFGLRYSEHSGLNSIGIFDASVLRSVESLLDVQPCPSAVALNPHGSQ